jgi:predicted glycogen debranching enzyme
LTTFAARLCECALQFIVRRDESDRSIVAGYPWFGDWGRDTFIALPGLCLATGHYGDARRIIRTFARFVDRGLIPNCFPAYGEPPVYNTCDATLWYVHAIDAYLRHTNDIKLLDDELFDVIANILEAHAAGTRHGIRMDSDGLLAAGETGHALTWMDAKIGDRTITPRIGKPVEINALWYNALCIGADLAVKRRDGRRAKTWCEWATRCRKSFNERFWNRDAAGLHDVVDSDHVRGRTDSRLRPNQLFAISLTHPVLEPARWRAVVSACERDLLTPMGMRTLAPKDADYRGRYAGDQVARDEAYHQGTVWPWLIGPFASAVSRAYGSDGIGRVARLFDGLETHLNEAGIGGICEVADGDAPHAPGGCPWQAWSVSEPLRVLVEELGIELPARAVHG